MSEAAALGFRTHSGWAAAVAVSGSPRKPVVLDRRRFELADLAVPASKQPYHAAEQLDGESAEALIRECRDNSTLLAVGALTSLVAQLARADVTVAGAGILFASERSLPNIAAILRSHELMHTAEGEFFREVLVAAAEQCALAVTRVKEREIWDRATSLFRLPVADLQARIDALGKTLGPPWRQDEKLASLAAWIALAESG
jgi:hypothetical protein